ncbi:hypothetical protein [Roseateles flavus]|uniref:Uncharacterized protein n=1 Tax=Roseateles flavus TaxID=3149041 RepID=A0ABV0GHC8_9BURK
MAAMAYALSWFLVACLLAAWSLALWALHGLAVWVLAQLGGPKGPEAPEAGGAGGPALPALPDWLEPWMPAQWVEALQSGLALLAPAAQQLLEALPLMTGGVTAVAWLVWGAGSVLLVVLGAVLHGLIALCRRSLPAPRPPLPAVPAP